MADPNIYFDASFGGIDLLMSSIDTDGGRDVAVQSPSRGDKHVLQDRGRKLRSATCTILFVDQAGLDPYLQRYEQFKALVDGGDPQLFSHPLDGSYRARAGELRVSAEAGTQQVQCTCTFLAEDEPTTTFPVGAGTTPAAGVEAVSSAVDGANTALANAGLSSTVPSSVLDTVTSWASATELDSQSVFLGIATMTQQINDAIDALQLTTALGQWPVYQAFITLSYQLVRAGEAFTVDSGQLFDLTVMQSMPLLRICAEVYGAALAPDHADKIAKINRVRTPGRVPKGTVLKMLPRTS